MILLLDLAARCGSVFAPNRHSGREAGTLFRVLRGDDTAVFLNNLLDDGQAEAGTLGFGGDVGLEQPIDQVRRHAAAVVFDAEFDGR
jgi:hypothetical protein